MEKPIATFTKGNGRPNSERIDIIEVSETKRGFNRVIGYRTDYHFNRKTPHLDRGYIREMDDALKNRGFDSYGMIDLAGHTFMRGITDKSMLEYCINFGSRYAKIYDEVTENGSKDRINDLTVDDFLALVDNAKGEANQNYSGELSLEEVKKIALENGFIQKQLAS